MIVALLGLLLVQDQGKIDNAVERGAQALLKDKLAAVKHPFEGEFATDEFVLYTLIIAGHGLDDKTKTLLDRVTSSPLKRTYNVALQAVALEELDKKKWQGRIAECGQWLVDTQAKNGQWGYGKVPETKDVATGSAPSSGGKAITIKKKATTSPENGDNSNSQYAALAIRSCLQANIKLPDETLSLAAKGWERTQNQDGGWGYCGEGSVNDPSCGSMTAGAVASLCILRNFLKVDPKKDDAVKKGLAWMDGNWSVSENPKYYKPVLFRFYWLYAIERAGMLYGTEKIGKHEWYKEGAEYLLKEQKADGTWVGGEKEDASIGGTLSDTCFAILFLRKATKALPRVATGGK
jgi:hypothetical protein